MKTTDKAAYDAAVAELASSDFTDDGLPNLMALNAILKTSGYAAIKADERNGYAALPTLELAPTDEVRFRLDNAQCNPVPLYITGVGSWELRIGETYTLPREGLLALGHTDAEFTVLEG